MIIEITKGTRSPSQSGSRIETSGTTRLIRMIDDRENEFDSDEDPVCSLSRTKLFDNHRSRTAPHLAEISRHDFLGPGSNTSVK
jgi:hypothetical protein